MIKVKVVNIDSINHNIEVVVNEELQKLELSRNAFIDIEFIGTSKVAIIYDDTKKPNTILE